MIAVIRSFRNKRDADASQEDENEEDDERDDGDDDDDDDDSDDDSDDGEADASGNRAEPELTRAERRELKKKQAAQKQSQLEEGEEEDPYLINPNHVEKKLQISDLGSPREPTRREKSDPIAHFRVLVPDFPSLESKRKRRMQRNDIGRYLNCNYF